MAKMGTQDETCPKRKVSCLACRAKKVKCDGGRPCGTCRKKGCECMYSKPNRTGRPPKNAVVNRLVLAAQQRNMRCLGHAFIFEHLSNNNTKGGRVFIFQDKTLTVRSFVAELYRMHFGSKNADAALLQPPASMQPQKVADSVKMFDLRPYFSWTASDIVRIALHRFSRVCVRNDAETGMVFCGIALDTSAEFFDVEKTRQSNPLKQVSHDEAMEHIECFFALHPFSILFNKTMLLQSYWTDRIEPLLLCVIYGTAMYFRQMVVGRPLMLWETTMRGRRNVFLDHAYVILSKLSAEATVSRYQSLILLGLLEGVFGYVRRSMALFVLAHIMAIKLGVFSGETQDLSPVERECLRMTFWAAYITNVRGCMDVDQVPQDALALPEGPPVWPPSSVHASVSYQYDIAHGQRRNNELDAYVLETFYTAAVTAVYSAKIYVCLPERPYPLFGPKGAMSDRRTAALTKRRRGAEEGIMEVLQSLKVFIDEHRTKWSPTQRYILESLLVLYSIHVKFVRRSAFQPVRVDDDDDNIRVRDMGSLDESDVLRMHSAVPLAKELADKMDAFLLKDGAGGYPEMMLPQRLLIVFLETSALVLMMKHERDPWDVESWMYLQRLYVLSTHGVWRYWTPIQETRLWLASFFDKFPSPPVEENQAVVLLPWCADDCLATTASWDTTSDEFSSFIKELVDVSDDQFLL